MLADGHQCPSELALLERLEVHEQLGLSRAELRAVVHTFCEDRLAFSAGMCWADLSLVKLDPLRQVLGEVDDLELQGRLMSLCIALVEPDLHLAEKESVVLQPPPPVPVQSEDRSLQSTWQRAA